MAAASQYRWILLAGVWLLYAAFGLAATSLAPLVNIISADLHISYGEMGIILGIWQFVYIGSSIPTGFLLDRLGNRLALTIGGLIVSASLFARGLADDFMSMMIAVMLFGLGGPIISAGAPTVIAGLFRGKNRGLAMGIYMTGPAAGGIVSLTLTHSILLPALDGSWRYIMFLWAGIAAGFSVIWLGLASHSMAAKPAAKKDVNVSQLEVFRHIMADPAVILVLLMSVGVFLFNHGLNNWLPELLHRGGMTLTQAGYWAAIPTIIGIFGSLLIPRLATGRDGSLFSSLSAVAQRLRASCYSLIMNPYYSRA